MTNLSIDEDKVKIQIDRDLANKLKSMMSVGETYSDIIRRLYEKSDSIDIGNVDDTVSKRDDHRKR